MIAEARNSAGAYAQLAQLAYQAGQTRKGDLARDKALELTDPDMREALKGQLDRPPRRRRARRRRSTRRPRRPPTATPRAEVTAALQSRAARPCSSTGRAADS